MYYRCDGQCKLFVQSERASFYKNSTRVNSFQAYLTGLDGDQISYATQASRIVTIDVAQGTKIQADILPRNYSHTEEKLYLGIKGKRYEALEFGLQSKRVQLCI